MEELLLILVMITSLFIPLLFLQQLVNRKICALCGAIVISWAVLLLLSVVGIFSSRLLIALLMGQSITGVYYLVEKKVSEQLTLFRLPFLLTLIVMGSSLLEFGSGTLSSILFVVTIWILFTLIYLFRHNPKLYGVIQRIIECCKKW